MKKNATPPDVPKLDLARFENFSLPGSSEGGKCLERALEHLEGLEAICEAYDVKPDESIVNVVNDLVEENISGGEVTGDDEVGDTEARSFLDKTTNNANISARAATLLGSARSVGAAAGFEVPAELMKMLTEVSLNEEIAFKGLDAPLPSLDAIGPPPASPPTLGQRILREFPVQEDDCYYTNLHVALECNEQCTYLDLSFSGMEEIPQSVAMLENLESLNMCGNEIRAIPEWLGELTKLEEIVLHSNKITSLPSSLRSLRNLRSLDLANNRLTSKPEWLSRFPLLRHLELDGNPIIIPEKKYQSAVIFPRDRPKAKNVSLKNSEIGFHHWESTSFETRVNRDEEDVEMAKANRAALEQLAKEEETEEAVEH